MRKKLTKKEKKDRTAQWVVGILLAFVMLGSIFGIVVDSITSTNTQPEKITYKGQEFLKIDNRYHLSFEDIQFSFINNPNNLTNTEVNITKTISNYIEKPLYLNSKDQASITEIYLNLERFTQRIQLACVDEEDCEGNLPIKNCEDNLIIIKESQENKIYQEENCIFIEGQELSKLTDQLILKLIGL